MTLSVTTTSDRNAAGAVEVIPTGGPLGAELRGIDLNALGEAAFASPALSRGQVIIRTASHLWCVGKPPASAASR
jgi:hypothetical protein